MTQDLAVPFSPRRSHRRSGLAQTYPVPQSASREQHAVPKLACPEPGAADDAVTHRAVECPGKRLPAHVVPPSRNLHQVAASSVPGLHARERQGRSLSCRQAFANDDGRDPFGDDGAPRSLGTVHVGNGSRTRRVPTEQLDGIPGVPTAGSVKGRFGHAPRRKQEHLSAGRPGSRNGRGPVPARCRAPQDLAVGEITEVRPPVSTASSQSEGAHHDCLGLQGLQRRSRHRLGCHDRGDVVLGSHAHDDVQATGIHRKRWLTSIDPWRGSCYVDAPQAAPQSQRSCYGRVVEDQLRSAQRNGVALPLA